MPKFRKRRIIIKGMNQTDSTHLYRHFGKDGALLYVGISLSAINRLDEHREKSKWFERISRVEIENFPSRKEAMKAELKAITEEKPLYNSPKLATRARKNNSATRIKHAARLEEIESALQAAIQSTRKAKELNQEDLAERMGWTYHILSNVEAGRREITVAEFIVLAQQMDVDPEVMFRRVMKW